jgi:hypothetical protein
VLAVAPVVMAQQKPEPVIRIGDFVEIGNEVFMNIIASGDFRYNTAHNLDFEDRIRDRANSRDPFSTSNQDQESEVFYVEARLGADFRYQKSLKFQILFEWQGTLDGNLIDDRTNASNPGGNDAFGRPASREGEGTNLERIWAEYSFAGTPVRFLIGADLWYSDQAGILGDDDPRAAIYFDLPGGLEIGAWAVLQTSSHRLGLQNDHDFMYYVGHVAFKGIKPMVIGLDAAYFRDRSNLTPALGTTGAVRGQKTDTFLIMPSFSASFGPITALLQPMLILGTVDGGLVGGVQPEYDVFAWGGVAYLEANLGIIRPFVGLYIGSADYDAGDGDLEGFAPFPQGEITLTTGTSFFGHLDPTAAIGGRDVVTPARNSSTLFGGQEFSHTVGNPYNDRLAALTHPGVATTYANPGTLVIPAGVKLSPVKSHELVLAYIYRAMLDSSIIENALGINVNETLYHEAFLSWEWTLNRHFDIRLSGSVLIPGAGSKDIAENSTTENCAIGGCQGEDLAFHAQARFRARF